MLPNQVLQKTVRDMAEIVGEVCSIWNLEGICLAYSSSISEAKRREVQNILLDMEAGEEIKKYGKAFLVSVWRMSF